jgi:hypothetical protein
MARLDDEVIFILQVVCPELQERDVDHIGLFLKSADARSRYEYEHASHVIWRCLNRHPFADGSRCCIQQLRFSTAAIESV